MPLECMGQRDDGMSSVRFGAAEGSSGGVGCAGNWCGRDLRMWQESVVGEAMEMHSKDMEGPEISGSAMCRCIAAAAV